MEAVAFTGRGVVESSAEVTARRRASSASVPATCKLGTPTAGSREKAAPDPFCNRARSGDRTATSERRLKAPGRSSPWRIKVPLMPSTSMVARLAAMGTTTIVTLPKNVHESICTHVGSKATCWMTTSVVTVRPLHSKKESDGW